MPQAVRANTYPPPPYIFYLSLYAQVARDVPSVHRRCAKCLIYFLIIGVDDVNMTSHDVNTQHEVARCHVITTSDLNVCSWHLYKTQEESQIWTLLTYIRRTISLHHPRGSRIELPRIITGSVARRGASRRRGWAKTALNWWEKP